MQKYENNGFCNLILQLLEHNEDKYINSMNTLKFFAIKLF